MKQRLQAQEAQEITANNSVEISDDVIEVTPFLFSTAYADLLTSKLISTLMGWNQPSSLPRQSSFF